MEVYRPPVVSQGEEGGVVFFLTTEIPRGVHQTICGGVTGLVTTLKAKVHGRQQNHQGTDQANDSKVKFVLFEMFFFLDKKGVARDRKHGQDERENNQTKVGHFFVYTTEKKSSGRSWFT